MSQAAMTWELRRGDCLERLRAMAVYFGRSTIDLSAEYIEQAKQRIENPRPEKAIVDVEGQMDLFGTTHYE